MHWVAILFVIAVTPAFAAADDAAFFESKVRPLLVAKCLACHTAAQSPMAGLALDSRERVLKGGTRGPAAVPGKPAESLLLRAVTQSAGVPKMPPTGVLKDADIAVLTEWVQRGLPWGATATSSSAGGSKYWAFAAPQAALAPMTKDGAWGRSPIDSFILAGLEAKGLKPAAPADKRTLIRRATYDLTGLPPTEAEVNAFLADAAPGAFAKVVDRLLESPRDGERWGRHWLDVARYADSNGLDENLVYRHAWRYRDYVIAAFNKDKPYDQFVREQIAGDLLPAPEKEDLAARFERWTATGFLSLGAKMLAEDDPKKMEMDIVDEQLDTAARTFMGLTVGCARCHDHKFDPIPTADYYAMAGIFKSSKTMENFKVVAKWHEYVLAPEAEVAKLRAHESMIEAHQKVTGRLHGQYAGKLATEARGKVGAYLLAAGEVVRGAATKLKPVDAAKAVAVVDAAAYQNGNAPKKLERGKNNVPAGHKGKLFAEYTVRAPAAGEYQVELLEEEAGFGTADLSINGVLMKKGAPPVQNRAASPDAGGWTVAGIFPLIAGDNVVRLEHGARFPYFEKLKVAPSPLPVGTGPKTATQLARQYNINPGYLEHWVAELERSQGAPASPLLAWHEYGKNWAAWTSPVAKLMAGWTPASREELADRYQQLFAKSLEEKEPTDPAMKELREFLFAKAGVFREPRDARQYFDAATVAVLSRLDDERKGLEASTPDLPRAMGVTEGSAPADLAINVRGSHWTLGKVVPRGFLTAVGTSGATPIKDGQSGRLQFAEWLAHRDHPLTSRVMVNRLWRWHFGRGIVPSTDNFGRLGEKPTNQALLDWLAVEFVNRGWSMKQMHRTMMLTSTYQMSSTYNPASAETDPENTLLWRMPRRRLCVASFPGQDGHKRSPQAGSRCGCRCCACSAGHRRCIHSPLRPPPLSEFASSHWLLVTQESEGPTLLSFCARGDGIRCLPHQFCPQLPNQAAQLAGG